MLKAKEIEPAASPWASNVLLVKRRQFVEIVHGVPSCQRNHHQFSRLQSVINAAATSIFNLWWLDQGRIKVAMLVFRCLHDLVPLYLSSTLHRVADMDTRRRLRSSVDTDILLVPQSRLVTVGDCSFPVTGPRTIEHGKIYQRQYAQHRLCCHFNDN